MNQLNIPSTIKVGYQNRSNTYTGQLAYVIYTDEKGKVRKENSWSNWRDDNIPPQDFKNEPTSGFVLNRGVGGTRESYGWNPRNEYIRVYDPRGHEFEISVANLLFILQECTSTKGKGLEGEFVYAWDKADLVLLPASCKEYAASKEFTKLKTEKVTKKDMVEGGTYQSKKDETLVYLGRIPCRKPTGYWKPKVDFSEELTPHHVFYNTETSDYHFEKGFTKLANILSKDFYPTFANLYTKFLESKYCTKVTEIILSKIDNPKIIKNGQYFIYKKENEYFLTKFRSDYYKHRMHQYETYIDIKKLKDISIIANGFPYYDGVSIEYLSKYKNIEYFTLKYKIDSGELIGAYPFE